MFLILLKGCYKTWWGGNCRTRCPEYCVDQHCHPLTGECIWGCRPNNCLESRCTLDGYCSRGCQSGLAGPICDRCKLVLLVFMLGFYSCI